MFFFTDIKPIYLTDALTSQPGQLPAGVKVDYDEASNTHAFTFTETAGKLGFPASSVFKYCDYFPEEFSVLLTFKSQSYSEETLITLLPMRGNGNTKFGVALNKGNLRILFQEEMGDNKQKYIDFHHNALLDGSWHTVIVSVVGNKVTFSLDCNGSKKTKTMKNYPAMMNVRDDFIHIGNGNRGKRGLFTVVFPFYFVCN